LRRAANLAEVVTATFGDCRAAFAAWSSGSGHLGLFKQVGSQGKGRTEQLAASCGTVFGQWRDGFKNVIGLPMSLFRAASSVRFDMPSRYRLAGMDATV
jgi:hypothetical protein